MHPDRKRWAVPVLVALLAACGGGGDGERLGATVPPPVLPAAPALTRVSLASPFAPACDASTGARPFQDAEVEPHVAVNPTDPLHLVGAWQQDRWSDGGAHGLAAAVSRDGGQTWSAPVGLPFSFCAGFPDFPRASDPWVAISPGGVAYVMALAFAGDVFQPGSASAMLVSRSVDGGSSWSAPVTLQRDGPQYFNDKNTMTADPANPAFVYAVWDRLEQNRSGPTLFARTLDGGLNWQPAVIAHEPGGRNQTIGNQIVVMPDGGLVLAFTELVQVSGGFTASIALRRSADRGGTWGPKIKIADLFSIGAADPETGHPIRDGSLLFDIAVSPAGQLAVAWQDARFSGGQRDGIALSRSADGGLTWSAPVQVNRQPQVQAFTPSLSLTGDGRIGLNYFDLRFNNGDAASLPAAAWLAVSGDGLNWSETRAAGPFELNLAPDANGYFIGDYHALRALGSDFLLFLVHSNASTANRTDVFSTRIPAAAVMAKAGYRAAALPLETSALLRQRARDNIERQLREEQPARKRKR